MRERERHKGKRKRKKGEQGAMLCSHTKKFLYSNLFFQVEELYVEILYTILHMIGCDADREEQAELVSMSTNLFSLSLKFLTNKIERLSPTSDSSLV